jgi:hypothetical protein
VPWPTPQDYNEAVQTPATSFSDADLRQGQPVINSLGLPAPCSGAFADVYHLRGPSGEWALKCFTLQVPRLRERYAAVSQHLGQAKLSLTVDFQYLDQGIRIGGIWYPAVKMRWVEGLALNQFVRENVDKPALLDALLELWVRMAWRLHDAQIAHGDIQHGNVILVRRNQSDALELRLIDYDGMWVPALARIKSAELGHPNYQHPQRLRAGSYGPEVDRFGLLVVAAALRCLRVGGRWLWERFDNSENLLFKEADFVAPHQSPLFAELLKLPDREARSVAARLMAAAQKPLVATPLLEEVFGGLNSPTKPPPVHAAPPISPPVALAIPSPLWFPSEETLAKATNAGSEADSLARQLWKRIAGLLFGQ